MPASSRSTTSQVSRGVVGDSSPRALDFKWVMERARDRAGSLENLSRLIGIPAQSIGSRWINLEKPSKPGAERLAQMYRTAHARDPIQARELLKDMVAMISGGEATLADAVSPTPAELTARIRNDVTKLDEFLAGMGGAR